MELRPHARASRAGGAPLELKLRAGIKNANKTPYFRQGDKVRNSDAFLLLFWPLKLTLKSPYPYNISVTQ